MAGSFGELVLLLGDCHIPDRERAIPEEFQRMLVPNKMQHVICTGNLGSRPPYEALRSLAPNVHVVAGSTDVLDSASSVPLTHPRGDDNSTNSPSNPSQRFPASKVIRIGGFRIGVVGGQDIIPWGDERSLGMMRRKLNVDILVSGYTHKNEVKEYNGYYHINPGSITGAFSPFQDKVIPSFVLLAIQGSNVVCYVYELVNGEVDVSKTEFSKKEGDF